MKEGPDIARIAALIGDPARANMLTALMHGGALTASELGREAGVTAQTASGHLARLKEGGLLFVAHQGRHRYYRLSGPEIAQAIESLMGLAARTGHLRVRPGPKDARLRRARTCYDHLAGELGVELFDRLAARGFVEGGEKNLRLTPAGRGFVCEFGVDLAALEQARRPVCRACLDWSERRLHMGGGLGAALLDRFVSLGWARRDKGSRAVAFSQSGAQAFRSLGDPLVRPVVPRRA